MQFAGSNMAFSIALFLYGFAALWQLFLPTYFGQQVQDEVIFPNPNICFNFLGFRVLIWEVVCTNCLGFIVPNGLRPY